MDPRRIGRYSLIRPIGRGGMGEVWEAVLHGPGGFRKPVAVKLLSGTGRPDALAHEARLGALLSHPNVVTTFELGEDDGMWFVAMELVRGESLSQVMKRGPLSGGALLDVGRQTAAGLGHIHALTIDGELAGLVHRDIKPANLLLDEDGVIRIVDLGIARLIGTPTAPAGSSGWMAPEQATGQETGQADLFSLGLCLLALATGERPLPRGVEGLLAVARIEDRLADPSFLAPADEVVSGLGDVLRQCLRYDPADRFADAGDLLHALDSLSADLGPGLPRRGSGPASLITEETVRLPPPLPGIAGAFVGRSGELAAIDAALAPGALVTLVGPGGMGKTRLAVQAASKRSGSAWFVDLSEAATAEHVAEAVARVIRVPVGTQDRVQSVGRALGSMGGALLILDNFERVVDVARSVIEGWRAAAPDLQILVTTRRPLGVKAEVLLAVGPMNEAAALALLRARSPRTLAPEEEAPARELVRHLDGLPLAIELAAGRTRALSVDRILASLEDRFRLLSGGGADLPDRHRSLRASLDGSWALLSPGEQAMLAQLSIFAGDFELQAAEAVVAPSPDLPWILDALDTLVTAGLVQARPELGRYRLLESIHAYAEERLEDPGPVEVRHGAWFAQRGTPEALASLDRRGGSALRATLLAELDDLANACERAVARGDGPVAAATALAATHVLSLRGPLARARKLLDAVATVAEPSVAVAAASARVHHDLGQLEDAREALDSAPPGPRTSPRDRAHWLMSSTSLLVTLGDFEGAMDVVEEILGVTGRGGLAVESARARAMAGAIALSKGDLDRAEAFLSPALEAHRRLGDAVAEARALGNLAVVARWRGELTRSVELNAAALARNREAGSILGEARVIGNQSTALLNQGRLAEALVLLQRSLALGVALSDHLRATVHIGLVAHLQARFDDAIRINTEAARQAADAGLTLDEIGARLLAGIVLTDLGAFARAEKELRRSLSLARTLTDEGREGLIRQNLAELHVEHGRFDDALDELAAAEGLLRHSRDTTPLGICKMQRAQVLLRQGATTNAIRVLEDSRHVLAHQAGPHVMGRWSLVRARVSIADGDFDDAASRLDWVEQTFTELGHDLRLLEVGVARVELAAARGRKSVRVDAVEAELMARGMLDTAPLRRRLETVRRRR